MPWSPFEVLLDQMLVEVLQLRLQELHERDDGLQREKRGVGKGMGGPYPAGHSTERGRVLLARASRVEVGLEGLPPTVKLWAGYAWCGPTANTGIKQSIRKSGSHCWCVPCPRHGLGRGGEG